MRPLLNTLYVLTPDVYIRKDGLNVVILREDKETFRIPIMNLESIVCFNYMGASPGVMKLCVDNHVALSLLTPHGQFIASVSGPVRGNVLLRRAQYRVADDEGSAAHIASRFIAGKVYNGRAALSRFCRDHKPEGETLEELRRVLHELRKTVSDLPRLTSRDSIMGTEGNAARLYFGVFRHLILNDRFTFSERSKRPPKDEVNALLSFFYTLLASDVRSALETVGLDPYVGFLHSDRPGRPALALDLMEEMRVYLVDRFVLSLINNRQVAPWDFIVQGENGYLLKDEKRKELLTEWQKRKRTEITHPYLGEKMPIGLLPYIQATLLARYLRGEIDDYPAVLMT